MIDYTKQAKSAAHKENSLITEGDPYKAPEVEVVEYSVEEEIVLALLKTKTQLSVINKLRAEGDSPERAKCRVEASLAEAQKRQQRKNIPFLLLMVFLLCWGIVLPVVAYFMGYTVYIGRGSVLPLLGAGWAWMMCKKINF